jgi:acyl-CoA synthetase (AMP-forming)/AMP-acid ligase II
MKDTLKISGVQVSPSELEVALMAHPDRLVDDVAVAGVSGGRTSDEKIPRAWVVLSKAGKSKGAAATIKVLEKWTRQNLTKQKWLRGGIEVVVEVRVMFCLVVRLTIDPHFQIPKSPTGKVLRRVLQDAYEEKKNVRAGAARSKL